MRRIAWYAGFLAVVITLSVSGQVLGRLDSADRQNASFAGTEQSETAAVQGRFEALMARQGIPAGALVPGKGSVQELTITIRRGPGAGDPAPRGAASIPFVATLTARRTHPGSPVLARAQEVGPSQLLVVVLDRNGLSRWSTAVQDPSVLRAEFPDADGNLSGQVLERPSADAVVVIPDDPVLSRAEVFRSGEAASGAALEHLGSIRLG